MKIVEQQRECDVLVVLHRHPVYKLTQMKYILARIKHTDDTYYFPDADMNIAKFGEAVLWDASDAERISIEKGLYTPVKSNKVDFQDNSWM